MGTPDLAVPTLNALVAVGHDVALVVTQPSRPVGRGRREQQPPVAVAAEAAGLPIYQPMTLRRTVACQPIAEHEPDAVVVVAYGKILPTEILELPRLGCLNVHFSLLPRHRGASPVSAAILAGDRRTGVTVMLMDATMDTGPILAQEATPIEDIDDQVTLNERLSTTGAELLVETLGLHAAGAIEPRPQKESQATYTRPTQATDGRLDWREPADACWRRVRAYAAWPQAFTHWEGKRLRILAADRDPSVSGTPGQVQSWGLGRQASVAIGTGEGVLLPRIVGLEGGRAMPIDAFLRGRPAFVGAQLG